MLAITNLTASVNGVNVLSVPSTIGNMGADTFNNNHNGLITGLLMPEFLWDFDVVGSSFITNPTEPLLGLLTSSTWMDSYPDSLFAFGHFDGSAASVRVSPVGVPEPKILGLLVLGLTGVWLRRR